MPTARHRARWGSIGTTEPLNYEMKMSQVDDPSYFVVCGDATVTTQIGSPMRMVYTACNLWGCGSDWVNCSFSQQCGVDAPHLERGQRAPSFRRTRTRHLGGSNIRLRGRTCRVVECRSVSRRVAAPGLCDRLVARREDGRHWKLQQRRKLPRLVMPSVIPGLRRQVPCQD